MATVEAQFTKLAAREGSDVAPEGTEAAPVLWSRNLSGRVK
jgi:hypothetical protein